MSTDNSQTPTSVDEIPQIPDIYAAYIDEKCIDLIDCKRTPNKEFIAYLLNETVARFKRRFPNIPADFSIKLEQSAQIQVLMLARILCVSSLSAGLSNITTGTVVDLGSRFHIASMEHDAWAWFAGAIGIHEQCNSLASMTISAELLAICERFVLNESISNALPGSSHISAVSRDHVAESAFAVIVNNISCLIFDFWSAAVDLDKKMSIKISNAEINGILRLFNHGRIPAQSSFFTELGQFSAKFDTIRKAIKAKDTSLVKRRGPKK